MIINRKKPNIYENSNVGVVFYPGTNVIPADKVEAVKNDKDCKEMIDLEIHEIMAEVVNDDKDKSDKKKVKKDILEEIKKLPAEKVIKIVKNTVVKETLNKIGDNDLRVGVQRAIKAQIELIDKQRKKKKDK